jgi:hypothetical protein
MIYVGKVGKLVPPRTSCYICCKEKFIGLRVKVIGVICFIIQEFTV